MQTIEAIYDGVTFTPKRPISIKGKHEVVITFLGPVVEVDNNLQLLLEPDVTKIPVLGRYDGLINIPEDFNAPLDEMKEYMD